MSNMIDNKIKLLAGKPIAVGEIPITPMTLGEIADVGYSKFQQNISLMSLTLDDMINSIDDFEIQAMIKANKLQYRALDLFLISNAMRDMLAEGIKVIFRTDNIEFIQDVEKGYVIIVDELYEINRENFDEIVKVINLQNNPEVSSSGDDEDYNPANDLAKSIAEKIKRGKEIAQKSKAMEEDKEGISLDDVISAVTGMSNTINKLNVWNLTLYQLYDEFSRLVKIDNYRLQTQAMMMSSDIEVEHWSEPL